MTNINQVELQCAVYHEIGHYVVNMHFRCQSHFTIFRTPNRTEDQKVWVGQTMPHFTMTPFQYSVTGWAGELCEPLGLGVHNVWDIDCDDILNQSWTEGMSATDIQCIEQHPQKNRALKCAERILRAEYEQIENIAEECTRRIMVGGETSLTFGV